MSDTKTAPAADDLPEPTLLHQDDGDGGSKMHGQTRSQKLVAVGFSRRPSLWAMQAREALELIAAPMRPDGTWNRDREACRQLAAEVLVSAGKASTKINHT